MQPLPDGTLRYSPRDLVAYLEGDFAAWCERMHAERERAGGAGSDGAGVGHARRGRPGGRPRHPEGRRARAALPRAASASGIPTIVEIDRADPEGPARTLAAMEPALRSSTRPTSSSDGWGGYPDFLFRCPGHDCACRGWHYTPWDTKLARSAKPDFLLQLCAYADMLEGDPRLPARPRSCSCSATARSGRSRPGTSSTTTGSSGGPSSTFQADWDVAAMPEPGLDRSWGRWEKTAEKLLEQSDHLSRVANITRGQVRRLEEAGIPTLTALAGCERSPGGSARSPSQVFERLRLQARLQLDSRGHPQPLWQHRAPGPEEPRRGLALLPPAVGRRRLLRHGRLPLRRAAGWSTCSAR